MSAEQQVVDYLTSLKTLEPHPHEVARVRRPRRRRTRRTLALSLAIVAASSALAAATGVLLHNDHPIPHARAAKIPVPDAISAQLGIFRRPGQPGGARAFYNLRTAEIDRGSIHAIRGGYVAYGRTRYAGDGVIVAAEGIGFEGPFPLENITRGTAWGYTKRTLTAITPDDVTRVQVTYRDKRRAMFIPRDNVVIAPLEGPTPIHVRYVR
jgi:hypothetical protein